MSSFKSILDYWPIILVVLQAVAVWACWSLRQMAKNEMATEAAQRLEDDRALEDRLDGHGDRITKVEGRMAEAEKDIKDLPTKADLARVEGEVKQVGVTSRATQEGVKRLEGYFLARGVDAS